MPAKVDYARLLNQFPNGVVAFDLETTGLSPLTDKIIEIGAIKITDDEEIIEFSALINPKIPIPPQTTKIHGITNEMTKNAPSQKEALLQFLKFIEELPLLAHNAQFDIGFLMSAIHQEQIILQSGRPVYDSCLLARKVLPSKEAGNYKLSNLSEVYNFSHEQKHRAKDDAYACLEIFNMTMNRIEGHRNIESNLKAAFFTNFDPNLMSSDFKLPSHLRPLLEFMVSGEIIEIFYRGGTFKNKFRPIKPIGFLPLPKGPVLFAICLHSFISKSFMLRKIDSFRRLPLEDQKAHEEKLEKNRNKPS